MKTIRFITLVIATFVLMGVASCQSSDDPVDQNKEQVQEENSPLTKAISGVIASNNDGKAANWYILYDASGDSCTVMDEEKFAFASMLAAIIVRDSTIEDFAPDGKGWHLAGMAADAVKGESIAKGIPKVANLVHIEYNKAEKKYYVWYREVK